MHKIRLYGLDKTSNDLITLTGGYAAKADIVANYSDYVDLDILYLRPHKINEGSVYKSPANKMVNDSSFRKQLEIESYPLKNNAFDIKENELAEIFEYYQVYVGIESFIFNPFQTMTTSLTLPVVLNDFSYNEINSIYKSVTMTLQAVEIG